MHKLKPITLESDVILVHPLRPIDSTRAGDIQNELLEILSDDTNTEFIPEKRLTSTEKAAERMFAIVVGYHTDQIYTLFITDKLKNKVIGLIDIVSPERAKENYQFDQYNWMIEYYLHKDYWGKGIMTGIIQAVCQRIKSQGIIAIAAMCDKSNSASIRVLEKVGFTNVRSLNIKQNYYILQ